MFSFSWLLVIVVFFLLFWFIGRPLIDRLAPPKKEEDTDAIIQWRKDELEQKRRELKLLREEVKTEEEIADIDEQLEEIERRSYELKREHEMSQFDRLISESKREQKNKEDQKS